MGVLAALLIGACGLPSSTTLQSPDEVEGGSVPGVMRFSGTAGGTIFRGYEIYYKLITSGEATPEPRHHDDLRAGFGRLSKADSGSCDGDRPPLVPVPDTARTGRHWVELDLREFREAATGQDAEPVLRFSWQQQQEVRRGIEDTDHPLRACRRFSTIDGYRPGDRDLSTAAAAAITARTGALIDLVAYAVSYGRDRGLPLYSAPLRIGRERLDLY